MSSNAGPHKLQDIPRKTPRQKCYIIIKTDPALPSSPPPPQDNVLQETPKNQRAATLKNHYESQLNIAAIIISLRRHYHHCHHDFHFTNNIACYSSLEARITIATY